MYRWPYNSNQGGSNVLVGRLPRFAKESAEHQPFVLVLLTNAKCAVHIFYYVARNDSYIYVNPHSQITVELNVRLFNVLKLVRGQPALCEMSSDAALYIASRSSL